MSGSCQQGAVYEAERLLEPVGETPAWGNLLTVEQAQEFLDQARDLYVRWLGDFPQVVRIEVSSSPGRRGSVGFYEADKEAGVADMDPDHLRPLILCHEAAHVLAEARFGSRSHDPWFARIYLELVYSLMAPEDYLRLQRAFDEQGVDYDVRLD